MLLVQITGMLLFCTSVCTFAERGRKGFITAINLSDFYSFKFFQSKWLRRNVWGAATLHGSQRTIKDSKKNLLVWQSTISYSFQYIVLLVSASNLFSHLLK